jgi:cell division protein ZipA|tara:strand:- start:4825 stop:5682 length:858 start_codon:yes stop_codon:yes gene_type:complete
VDIKDLILVVGGFFFVAVVGHGLWVAWKTKQNDITMDIQPSTLADNVPAKDLSKGEFPSGGARITNPDAAVEPMLDDTPQPAQGSLPLDQDIAALTSNVPASATENSLTSEVRPKSNSRQTKAASKQQTVKDEVDARAAPNSPDELIILGVLAKSGKVFAGPELVDALRGQGLKFGNMSIFHRIDSATDEHLFSVANALEPGTFDLADMQALTTPGITFFLQLPVPGDAFETLEDMLLSARTVAAALGGDVKDDQMNTLTGQTVEHMRQRLADYARMQLTQRPQQ